MSDADLPILHSIIPPAKLQTMVRMAQAAPKGNFAEVGVLAGGSAFALYIQCIERNRRLYLYDTFEGHPHKSEMDAHAVGSMKWPHVERLRRLMPEAVICKGIFPHTLTDDVQNLAFVHEDTDQYESTKSVIEAFWPRLVPGGMILFDDYDTFDCKGSKYAIDNCGHRVMFFEQLAFIMKPKVG